MSEPKVVSSAQGTEPGPLDIAQITQGLGANRLATTIHYFPEIGSTNSYAKERAESGAGEGELVVAESQSQGRGRLGRRWESPPFANLYVSILLRPKLSPAHAAQITLMAAVALAEVVEASSRRSRRSNGPTIFSSAAKNLPAYSPKRHARPSAWNT